MELTNENYFNHEFDMKYCSKSQYASFFGTPVIKGCEKRALAELRGEYERPKGDALLLGSYVDCILTEPEQLDKFIETHPEMFSSRGATKGELKTQFKKAEVMADRCKRDAFFMGSLDGDHQTIMTGELYGVPFKIKMDCYKPGKFITDLKTTRDIQDAIWSPVLGRKVNFMQAYSYDLQGAIYQEIVFQNTGKRLPFFISAVSSQEHPRIGVFQIDQDSMDDALKNAEDGIRMIPLLKSGEVEPTECGECDYCADTIQLSGVSDWLFRETEDTDRE